MGKIFQHIPCHPFNPWGSEDELLVNRSSCLLLEIPLVPGAISYILHEPEAAKPQHSLEGASSSNAWGVAAARRELRAVTRR